MEEQETMRDVTRRLQDAARKGQERVRETSDEAMGIASVATTRSASGYKRTSKSFTT